ncbi:hypothetical protein HZZ00_25700 [Streptomyces sp. NEAU-sy36]|uniref:hypothetical protein n=1 Tax=unclassified Streptomyces TaxID=2593676 RepID=UPI0015D5DF35|nr:MULTISPECIES: hypothetical protein [unclassified Streptomyces]QLJ04055.1 hypothetical protein HZZ00_25700 [Streptomyces sp. NEAU-sy36]
MTNKYGNLMAAMAGVAVLATASVATATAAQEARPARAAASCGTSIDPNTRIPAGRRHTGPTVRIGGATVQVRYGNAKTGAPYYVWAVISGARGGDTVSLEWDVDHGSWADFGVCSGTVHTGGKQNTRAVKYVHGRGWHLEAQACGRHAGRRLCTAYWP